MDQTNFLKNFLTKKTVFAIFAVAIVAEIAWATFTLFNPSANILTQNQSTVSKPTAAITLTADKSRVRVGEKFTVYANLSSNKKTDGTDLVIFYDPKVLSVDTVQGKGPVAFGTIYKDYPSNSSDAQNGKIMASGITDQKNGVSTNGLFGSLVFTAKSAGQTKISLDFTLGKTTDSNVIETVSGKDILDSVGNLDINVLP